MENVSVAELFPKKYQRPLIATVSNIMKNNDKLKNAVNNACLEYLNDERKRKRSTLQTRLFKKSMVGYRRDISVDYAIKMLIERLSRALHWMRYHFNCPIYSLRTYNRLTKIQPISACKILF
tara:strand:- start:150 stop:515 length:366 start_codon:yes stop_codon:yes gene_type:complete